MIDGIPPESPGTKKASISACFPDVCRVAQVVRIKCSLPIFSGRLQCSVRKLFHFELQRFETRLIGAVEERDQIVV